MSFVHDDETEQINPVGSEPQDTRSDLVLPSFFIVAAAVILALQDPINMSFVPRPAETLAAVAVGTALVAWGTLRRNLPLLLAGVAALLLTMAVGVTTQPSQLNVPVVAIWPLRVALVMLVAFSWGLLMHPPDWLTRGLMAVIVPVFGTLAIWGGPATAAQIFGGTI